MAKIKSFTNIEHELLPDFRKNMGLSESTEDVRKFFFYTVRDLFEQILEGSVHPEYEDITLVPDQEPPFILSDRLKENEKLKELWDSSDLLHIINRFAEAAVNHYRHLEKHPEKTEAKIRQ